MTFSRVVAVRRLMCSNKVQHPTRASAEVARRRLRKREKVVMGATTEIAVYICPYCGYYHIGHNKSKMKVSNTHE